MDKPDLFAAARDGRLSALAADTLTSAALLQGNASGNTPLHLAAKYGHLDQVPPGLLTTTTLLHKNDAG